MWAGESSLPVEIIPTLGFLKTLIFLTFPIVANSPISDEVKIVLLSSTKDLAAMS